MQRITASRRPFLPIALSTCAFLLMSSSLALASSEEHGAMKHHIPGVFIGATTDAHDKTELTFGIEYEYRFNHQYGVGAIYETSPDGHDGEGVTVMLVGGFWHPKDGWRLGAGVGQEKIEGAHPVEESLVRVGAAYDFHVGGLGVAPTFNLDMVDGENIFVYGVAISKAF